MLRLVQVVVSPMPRFVANGVCSWVHILFLLSIIIKVACYTKNQSDCRQSTKRSPGIFRKYGIDYVDLDSFYSVSLRNKKYAPNNERNRSKCSIPLFSWIRNDGQSSLRLYIRKNYTRRFKDTDLFEQIFSIYFQNAISINLLIQPRYLLMQQKITHKEALFYETLLQKKSMKIELVTE